MDTAREYCETQYRNNRDPWSFRTRWYEKRKRALILACLPASHYHRVYEPGCANGELLAALAGRSDEIIGSEGVKAAALLAKKRVENFSNARVVQGWIPEDFPAGAFDLIVFGEIGYYLSLNDLLDSIKRMDRALFRGGTLVACHWRHPIAGCPLSGDSIHHAINRRISLGPLVHHLEADFVLDVWSTDRRSVAAREGLVGL